jgi:hypothetical protein
MHSKPTLFDWKVVAINDNCVSIVIDEDLSLDGVKIKVLGKDRNFLFEQPILNREILFCTPTGDPVFVELHTPSGVSVHYVKGSGKDYYISKINKN